jgi:hypothetical protein
MTRGARASMIMREATMDRELRVFESIGRCSSSYTPAAGPKSSRFGVYYMLVTPTTMFWAQLHDL